MQNRIHVARKLNQIAEILKEIELLIQDEKPKKQRKPRQEFLVSAGLVSGFYPKDLQPTRWLTCSDICKELGLNPDRANCTSVGATMSAMGFDKRRSNGKTLINVPDITF